MDFDLTCSVTIDDGLADRVRVALYAELCEIEADAPEVLALEEDLPGLWARALDRQLDPFAIASGLNEFGDAELAWFGDVRAPAVDSAADALAAIWESSGVLTDPGASAFGHLTCAETDALADLLRAVGLPDVADRVAAQHGLADDDENDAHHEFYAAANR